MNRRAAAFWAGIVLLLLVVGFLSGGRRQSGPPLHPESTDPNGTRALMILLDERGATITDGLPTADAATALVLDDQLDDGSRSQLDDWVAGGGTLVVVDPSSAYAPGAASNRDGEVLAAGDCTVPDLAELTLEAGSFLLYSNADLSRSASDWCFGDGDRSYISVRPDGTGRIVSLGGGLPFTNENLDEADNAVVAARLLLDDELFGGPGSGVVERRTVAVLFDPIVAPGSKTLGDLIPTEAKWAAAQLLVAFALYVLWRLPRFGRPVPEPQPVELPASLLVRATGELHRRSGGHGEASSTLRADLARRLRRQLRASPELPTADLVEAAAANGPVAPDVVARAVAGPPAADGEALSALIVDIDAVNHAVLESTANHTVLESTATSGARSVESASGVGVGASITTDDPTIGDHP